MQYTPLGSSLSAALPTLRAAFANVPDPRRSPNTYFSAASLLLAATAALLANHLVLAMAEWLAGQDATMRAALGFTSARLPVQSTFQRFFKALDPEALNTALTRFFDPPVSGEIAARGTQAIAIDGKSLRGSLPFRDGGTPTHLRSLFCHDLQVVVAQTEIAATQNEASAAPAPLDQIDWRGRVMTGDAIFCHRDVCRQVVNAGVLTC